MEILLNFGVMVDSIPLMNSHSPLFATCVGAQPAAAKYLLERGANIHEKTQSGYTPLIVLCLSAQDEEKRLEILEILLFYGIDINAVEENGRNALMIACEKSGVKIVEYLLSHGADVNLKTSDNRGIFHFIACRTLHDRVEDLVDIVAQYGGDLNLINDRGLTPLTLALRYYQDNYVDRFFALYLLSSTKFYTIYTINNDNEVTFNLNLIHELVKAADKRNDWTLIDRVIETYPRVKAALFTTIVSENNVSMMDWLWEKFDLKNEITTINKTYLSINK